MTTDAVLTDTIKFTRQNDTAEYATPISQLNSLMNSTNGSYHAISSAVDVTLTNPLKMIQSITMTVAAKKVFLPPMNVVNSIPVGRVPGLLIVNAGAIAFDVYAQDGTTVVFSNVLPGRILFVNLTDNTTANGSFQSFLVFNPSLTINDQSGTSYKFAATDNGGNLILANAAAITLTLPQQSDTVLPVGFNSFVKNAGAGKVTIASQGSDVISGNGFIDSGNLSGVKIVLRKTVATVNTWDVYGADAT